MAATDKPSVRLVALPVDPDIAQAPPRSAHRRLDVLCAVALGGGLGAPARYGIGLLLPTVGGEFPWGTFLINVSGSFALSVLIVLIVERLEPGTRLARYVGPAAGVGFLGAYTTYSAYAVEIDSLARTSHGGLASIYALASLAAGLGAAYLGMLAAGLIDGSSEDGDDSTGSESGRR